MLPLFALMVRRALASGIEAWAVGAGLVLAATAYTAYYYVVYLAFFLAVYLIAWLGWAPVRWTQRVQAPETRRIAAARWPLLVAVLAAIASGSSSTGGRTLDLGPGASSCPMHSRRTR